jgi:hypothetical protein
VLRREPNLYRQRAVDFRQVEYQSCGYQMGKFSKSTLLSFALRMCLTFKSSISNFFDQSKVIFLDLSTTRLR